MWLRQEEKHLAETMTGTCERYNKKYTWQRQGHIYLVETRTGVAETEIYMWQRYRQ